MGSFFGGGKQTSTQTYKPPSWVENTARGALSTAQRVSETPYQAYTGQRVAPLSQNEQAGIDLARRSAGGWMSDIDAARGYLQNSGQKFTDADIQSYMNPFIKGALDPAARELNEDTQRRVNTLQGQQKSRGAFGGGRATLMEQETVRGGQEALSDLYGRGYAQAFESGASRWAADRENDRVQAQSYLATAAQSAGLLGQDVANLISTGQIDRSVRQSMQDFDYQQFVEGRDWDVRNLSVLMSALQGIKGSFTEQQTTEKETESNPFGQLLGLAATAAGAYFSGGTSLLAGAGAAAAGTGVTSLAGATSTQGMVNSLSGSWTNAAYPSDVRLKENIRQIGPRHYTWDWNETAIAMGFDSHPTEGELAQEVLQYDPARVMVHPSGYLMIRRAS